MLNGSDQQKEGSLKPVHLLQTRVCSCNIFNRRAKQLVKVICTLMGSIDLSGTSYYCFVR